MKSDHSAAGEHDSVTENYSNVNAMLSTQGVSVAFIGVTTGEQSNNNQAMTSSSCSCDWGTSIKRSND